MEELKTLKDIEHPAGPFVDSDVDDYRIILKQEAIKWIKKILPFDGSEDYLGLEELKEKTGFDIDTSDTYYIYLITDFIKHFFNITEEDLKQWKN